MPGSGPIDPEIIFAVLHGSQSATWEDSHLVLHSTSPPAAVWLVVTGDAWDVTSSTAILISRETFDAIASATACTNGGLIIDGARKQLASVNGWAVLANL